MHDRESEPEPWPDPVDGTELLGQIHSRICRHVVVSEAGAIAVSFWILQTWLHADVATHSPILAPFSAEPDSGKSTLLHVASYMCPRSIIEVRPTVSIYQTINEHRPTWFVEEADNLFDDAKLQEIVNASLDPWLCQGLSDGSQCAHAVRRVLPEGDRIAWAG